MWNKILGYDGLNKMQRIQYMKYNPYYNLKTRSHTRNQEFDNMVNQDRIQ